MKLTYRGVSYEYNPPVVETTEAETVGKYRGLDWRFRNPQKLPVLQSNLELKYRGVAYNSNPQTATTFTQVAEPVKAPVLSVSDRARSLMLHHTQAIANRQQAMLSRVAAELG